MRVLLTACTIIVLCATAAAQTPLSAAREQALKPGDAFRECAGCPGVWSYPRSDLQGQAYRYINAGVRVAREIGR